MNSCPIHIVLVVLRVVRLKFCKISIFIPPDTHVGLYSRIKLLMFIQILQFSTYAYILKKGY